MLASSENEMRRHKDIVNTRGNGGIRQRRTIESRKRNPASHPITLDAFLREAARKAFRLMGED